MISSTINVQKFLFFVSDFTVCWIKAGHMFQTLIKYCWSIFFGIWSLLHLDLESINGLFISLPSAEHNIPCMNPRASVSPTSNHSQSCCLFFCVQSEVQSLHPLVEKHVSVGRQDLLQAGFSHRVVRHPKPLRAEGKMRRGRATSVCDEMSWVHVAVVNQHSRELEQILWRAARNKETKRRN